MFSPSKWKHKWSQLDTITVSGKSCTHLCGYQKLSGHAVCAEDTKSNTMPRSDWSLTRTGAGRGADVRLISQSSYSWWMDSKYSWYGDTHTNTQVNKFTE